MSLLRFDIRVCRGSVCAGQRDADRVFWRLQALLSAAVKDGTIALDRQSCFGRCTWGANVYIRQADPRPPALPRSVLYSQVVENDADAIVSEHIRGGRVISRLVGPRAIAAAAAGTDD